MNKYLLILALLESHRAPLYRLAKKMIAKLSTNDCLLIASEMALIRYVKLGNMPQVFKNSNTFFSLFCKILFNNLLKNLSPSPSTDIVHFFTPLFHASLSNNTHEPFTPVFTEFLSCCVLELSETNALDPFAQYIQALTAANQHFQAQSLSTDLQKQLKEFFEKNQVKIKRLQFIQAYTSKILDVLQNKYCHFQPEKLNISRKFISDIIYTDHTIFISEDNLLDKIDEKAKVYLLGMNLSGLKKIVKEAIKEADETELTALEGRFLKLKI